MKLIRVRFWFRQWVLLNLSHKKREITGLNKNKLNMWPFSPPLRKSYYGKAEKSTGISIN